jgi:hypothetical protein
MPGRIEPDPAGRPAGASRTLLHVVSRERSLPAGRVVRDAIMRGKGNARAPPSRSLPLWGHRSRRTGQISRSIQRNVPASAACACSDTHKSRRPGVLMDTRTTYERIPHFARGRSATGRPRPGGVGRRRRPGASRHSRAGGPGEPHRPRPARFSSREQSRDAYRYQLRCARGDRRPAGGRR